MLIAVLIIGLVFGFLSGGALGYAVALADRPVRDPRAVPDPRAAPLTVDVALVGDPGGSVTRLTIPATARRPKMTWPSPGGGLRVFQASHKDGTGTWIYRQTAVEPR
jgi:hypothetical protein